MHGEQPDCVLAALKLPNIDAQALDPETAALQRKKDRLTAAAAVAAEATE